MDLSLGARHYNLQLEPIRRVRWQLARSKECAGDESPPRNATRCLLVEGDLDEIVSATALRAVRNCVGTKATGDFRDNEIDAAIAMPLLRYGFGFASTKWVRDGHRWPAWEKPPFVHRIGPGRTIAGPGSDIVLSGTAISLAETAKTSSSRAWLGEEQLDHSSTSKHEQERIGRNVVSAGAVSGNKVSEKMGYVYQERFELVHTSGKPLGWHLAWTLDGAPGLANKVLTSMIERLDIELPKLSGVLNSTSAAALYGGDRTAATIAFFEALLQDPMGDHHDGVTVPSGLGVEDLPETVVSDPDEFRGLLGENLFWRVKGEQRRRQKQDALRGRVSKFVFLLVCLLVSFVICLCARWSTSANDHQKVVAEDHHSVS